MEMVENRYRRPKRGEGGRWCER